MLERITAQEAVHDVDASTVEDIKLISVGEEFLLDSREERIFMWAVVLFVFSTSRLEDIYYGLRLGQVWSEHSCVRLDAGVALDRNPRPDR